MLEAMVIVVPKLEADVPERSSVGDCRDIAAARVFEHDAVDRALDRDVPGQAGQSVRAGD